MQKNEVNPQPDDVLINNITNRKSLVLGISCLLCYFFIFLCVDIQYEKTGLLLAISSSLFFITTTLIMPRSHAKGVELNIIDVSILSITFYFALSNLFIGKLPSPNDKLYNILTFSIIYFLFKTLLSTGFNYLFLFSFIVLLGIIQSVIGIFQNYDLISPVNELFKVTGTFENPSVLGNLLAGAFPLSLFLILYKVESKGLFYLGLIFLVIGFFVLLKLDARAAWLGALAGSFYILNERFCILSRLKKRRYWGFYLIPVFVALCIAGIWLYRMKPDSVSGLQ